MDTEMIVRESTLPVPMVTVQQWAERRKMFNEWVNTQLKAGTDYGTIPGTDKPTLLKPGAEKITQLYGCAAKADVVLRQQDPATGYLYVEVRCDLVSVQTGQIVATGLGACSSFESKYRWRWEWWNARHDPPADQGYERTKSGKWRRRIENRDLIDQWNTVLKIAKKRALVDASLSVSGASEKFTQDVEDMADSVQAEHEESAPEQSIAPSPQPSGNGGQKPHWIKDPKIRVRLWAWAQNEMALSDSQVHQALGVEHIEQYAGTMADAKAAIEAWAAQHAKNKLEEVEASASPVTTEQKEIPF